jgi:myo-inositol catabolism protein IolC
MALGYDQPLYILAFDHRGSFEKQLLGLKQPPTAAELACIKQAKSLIYDGFTRTLAKVPRAHAGVLVDEAYGAAPARQARADGVVLAMPVEKSGQDEFDFEHGERFGEHVEAFDPTFVKVLVRYNPAGDAALNARQTARLARLSAWLQPRGRKLLFELLVPATPTQLASVGGDAKRYDAELRADLMVGAIAALQAGGVEADVWKIEGLDDASACARVAAQTRAGGRDGVGCVVLGRGADSTQVDRWLRAGAVVPGYLGFAIGRSIFAEPLATWLRGIAGQDEAARTIAARYEHFVETYVAARSGAAADRALGAALAAG